MITLERTGNRPLEFDGSEIATIRTRYAGGRDHNRWYEVTLYETNGGKYVIAITYGTIWEGESENYMAQVFDTIKDVTEQLRNYDPCSFILNMPNAPQFNDKQGRIRAELARRYNNAVSEVLADFPEKVE